MNYFTHAVRFLDDPYFVAGVCVPDWLSVIDRKARVRRNAIEASLPNLQGDDDRLVRGIRQHLDDDRWFHGTAGFYSVTALLAKEFRECLPEDDSWRCGFLGHIVMELLLDAVLIELDEDRLEQFYLTIRSIDADRVQETVSCLATRRVPDLARMIDLFVKERFLEDYLDDSRLLFRLNQVMRRIGLDPLPDSTVSVLAIGRSLVRMKSGQLLPADHFDHQILSNAE